VLSRGHIPVSSGDISSSLSVKGGGKVIDDYDGTVTFADIN